MQPRFPAFLTFIVTDLDGRPFCDSNSDRKSVNVAARAYFASVLKTGAFTVGEFSIGLSVPRKVIQFALPFYGDDGRMSGVIIAPLGLDWLADYIAQKGAPAGAALAITDRNGMYLARYPDNGRFVGRKLPAGKDGKVTEPRQVWLTSTAWSGSSASQPSGLIPGDLLSALASTRRRLSPRSKIARNAMSS